MSSHGFCIAPMMDWNGTSRKAKCNQCLSAASIGVQYPSIDEHSLANEIQLQAAFGDRSVPSSTLFTVLVEAFEEIADQRRDLVGRFVEGEMSSFEEMDFCARNIVGISCAPGCRRCIRSSTGRARCCDRSRDNQGR
jgi:hypothetical protein